MGIRMASRCGHRCRRVHRCDSPRRRRGLVLGPGDGGAVSGLTELRDRHGSRQATKTKADIDIDITSDMLAAGLQVLIDSGVLDQGAGVELPTGADETLV